MSGRVFWVAATILLAIVVHLTYVLFAPGDSVGRKLQAMRTLAGVNSLKVLSANDSRSFLGGEGPGLVHAICVFDLGKGEVKAEAPIPRGYWSVSIYTAHGTNIYTLNDRQAQVDFLSLVLRKASALRETENPVGVDSTLEKIFIDVTEPTGVIVMRAALPDEPARARIEEELARARCEPA
jgi:uncharacterized membrane protein